MASTSQYKEEDKPKPLPLQHAKLSTERGVMFDTSQNRNDADALSVDWTKVDWSNFDWSKLNLYAHGNYFAATYYTNTKGSQRHVLSVLASKLDVRKANPFDQIARYITQEELEFMTALGSSALLENLAVLSGEVYKPLPSVDDGQTALWLDMRDNPTRKSPSMTQRRLMTLFAENSCKIYVVRVRRQSDETGLNAATSYGVTSQMIADYKEAIMTGKVVLNQDVNHDELVIAYDTLIRGKPLKSPYPEIRGTGNSVPQNSGYGPPKFGVRSPKIRGTTPSEAIEQPARQGAFLTVDKEVDKEVDKLKTQEEKKAERERSGATGGDVINISKTEVDGAIASVLLITEKRETITLIRNTLLRSGFRPETIIRASEEIYMEAGHRKISHSPDRMKFWKSICKDIQDGTFDMRKLEDKSAKEEARISYIPTEAEKLSWSIEHESFVSLSLPCVLVCEYLLSIDAATHVQGFYNHLLREEMKGRRLSAENLPEHWQLYQTSLSNEGRFETENAASEAQQSPNAVDTPDRKSQPQKAISDSSEEKEKQSPSFARSAVPRSKVKPLDKTNANMVWAEIQRIEKVPLELKKIVAMEGLTFETLEKLADQYDDFRRNYATVMSL